MPRINRNISQRAPLEPAPDADALGAIEGRAQAALGGAIRGAGRTVGNVVSQIAQVRDGHQEQLSLSKGVEAEDQLRRFTEDLEDDSDFDAREKKLLERGSVLREELGRDISPGRHRASFENGLTRDLNRHSVTVRAGALRDGMASAELLANDTTRRLATKAATASSPFDQLVARLEGEGVYDALQEKFGVDPAHTEEAKRQFNLEVDDAIFSERLRNDPVDAFRQLQNPEIGLARGRTEVERQSMLTKSINEIERRIHSDHQGRIAEARIQEIERKTDARNGQNALVAAAQTDEGVTIGLVNKLGDSFDPTTKQGWLEFAANGGKIKRTELNVEVFSELDARAKSGEDITDETYLEEGKGNLNAGSRTALLTESDSRFDIADKFLLDALRVGEFAMSPAVRKKNAEANLLYKLWKKENPNATVEQAIDQARIQADRALVSRVDSIVAFQTPPRFAVFNADKTINIEDTELELARQNRNGTLTDKEFNRELDLNGRFDEAQKAQKVRDKLKAQQAEARK